jgi:hypothetical protein
MVITNNAAQIKTAFHKNSRKAVEAAAIEWRNGIVECLTGTRSGREYRKPGTRAMYRASRPGEAPASVTGRLRSSYRVRVISDTEAEVGSPLDYAEKLEKGTSRMLPRPHIEPGFQKKRREIEAALQTTWDT